jgi:hypothetical protein
MSLPKTKTAALARQYTREAIEILVDILHDRKASQTVRDAALRSLVAHGWIKPATRPDAPDAASKLH